MKVPEILPDTPNERLFRIHMFVAQIDAAAKMMVVSSMQSNKDHPGLAEDMMAAMALSTGILGSALIKETGKDIDPAHIANKFIQLINKELP